MDNCTPLYVKQVDECFVSRFEPTPEELAVLNAGGSVELWIVGCQPPIHIRSAPPEVE